MDKTTLIQTGCTTARNYCTAVVLCCVRFSWVLPHKLATERQHEKTQTLQPWLKKSHVYGYDERLQVHPVWLCVCVQLLGTSFCTTLRCHSASLSHHNRRARLLQNPFGLLTLSAVPDAWWYSVRLICCNAVSVTEIQSDF